MNKAVMLDGLGASRNRKLAAVAAVIAAILLLNSCDFVRQGDGLDSVREALSSVCNGIGVERAKAYEPYKECSAPHPIVLMDEAGNEHEWSDDIPDEWRPTSVEDTELVLCAGPEIQSFR
jgi:hypothetical protein